MDVMFAVTLAAMLGYWYLLFLTKRRWNTLAVRGGQLADYDVDRSLAKTLRFVLTDRYRAYSDLKLARLVVWTRIAFGVVATALIVDAVAT